MAQAMLDNLDFQLDFHEEDQPVVQDHFLVPPSAPTLDQSSSSILPLTPDQMEIPPKRKSSTPKSFSSNMKRNHDGKLKQPMSPESSTQAPAPAPVQPPQPPSQPQPPSTVKYEMDPSNMVDVQLEQMVTKYPRGALKFVRMLNNALPPFRATPKSAGFDLCSPIDFQIDPGALIKINTGLAIELPSNTYGQLTSRSSLASKGLTCITGTLDEDYRGCVFILLKNDSKVKFRICRGDAIAQLICIKISYPKAIQVRELKQTLRGTNGFGSSNIDRKNYVQ